MAGNKCEDMELATQEYLKKHKLLELLENVTAFLVFERPENPKKFVITYIKKLIELRATGVEYPCLFDSSNIKCLFEMLDVSGSGYISFDQHKSAFKAVGAKTCDDDSPGAAPDEVSLGLFLSEISDGLSRASATFALQ